MDDPEAAAGTRFTTKGRATRARIVHAAAELMFERGVSRTSMDAVQKAASVGGSQLYHYFTDKNSLVQAVIAYQIEQLVQFHTQPKLVGMDSFEALTLWAELTIDGQVKLKMHGGCSFGSLAAELAEADDDIRQRLAVGYVEWNRIVCGGLAAMRDRGVLRPEAEPEALAAVLIAAHQGGILVAEVRRNIEPLRWALQGALDQVYSYAGPGVERPVLRRRRRGRASRAAGRERMPATTAARKRGARPDGRTPEP